MGQTWMSRKRRNRVGWKKKVSDVRKPEEEKRKTNWAALLEVAREKDMTTAEKNGPGKGVGHERREREDEERALGEKGKGAESRIAHGA